MLPEIWSVVPFILLLFMIATGPVLYKEIWHKYYPVVSVILGASVIFYYIFHLDNPHAPIHTAFEFISFIALLIPLYVASGGILINVDTHSVSFANIAILIAGAILANIIGTTGASMLLIRPYLRLNRHRAKPYHVVFFIFMVSNAGGCLTPIGDPPLFIGFLKGVPFFWTIVNLWPAWIFINVALSAIFYFFDKKNNVPFPDNHAISGQISVKGLSSFAWLMVAVSAVFLDPSFFPWLPSIHYHEMKFSFLREIIMLLCAVLAYKTANKQCLHENGFDFEPIKEVVFLFFGIFATMMPALELVSSFATADLGKTLVTKHTLYWATGLLSSILDNAPTYFNFLAAGMGKAGLNLQSKVDVLAFANNESINLVAISLGAVFFGAMTYIGNAPNFMVKSVAEQSGVNMPSFAGYIVKYSAPILLPLFFLIWAIFL